ncbi:MAG: dihydropteroate synthase [Gammaproteobacteria bacterium]|nr:dihydropteroate synthase [Gammaproteobacteria bacterium]
MGILNITADSFSDGGELLSAGRLDGDALLRRAEAMVEAGADLLDLGAESTRPGAEAVAESEELERLTAALALLRPRFGVVLSVDSSSPAVFAMAAAAGADLLNDVRALRRTGALEAARESGLPVCLMHMQGEPGTMQDDPRYHDVLAEVGSFLSERVAACEAAGIGRDRILLDPGFGFGKRLEHNLTLLADLQALAASGLPILVGMSRKRMLGELTGRPTSERVAAGVAAAVLAAERGAAIIRTHDVAATVDGLKVLEGLNRKRGRQM